MNALAAVWRHRGGRIGLVIVVACVAVGLLGALGITPRDPLQQFRVERLKPPSFAHLMGTDLLGRDTASRLMLGLGQSFAVAFASVAAATVAGTAIGLAAAWWGGLVDGALMRLVDVVMAFPAILLALLVIAVAGPGAATSMAAIAVVYTPIFARVVRGPALSLRSRAFVEAAQTFGSARTYILSRHLLFNLVAPLAVQVTLALAWSLLTEAGLSFLGLGTQPPTPSLGLMLSDSRNLMQQAPWLMLFPSLAIMLSILGFNLAGDALRDALDPKSRGRAG